MKKMTLTPGVFAKLAFAMAFAGLFVVSDAWARVFTVKLKPDSSQTELIATTAGTCINNNHKGCIRVKLGQNADINFILTEGNKSCNLGEGATWELSAVYLGGKDSASKPGSWGGLDSEIQEDFDVADAASGLLNHANGSNARHIKITDENNYKYDVWYTVVATCKATNGASLGEIEIDPRLSNICN